MALQAPRPRATTWVESTCARHSTVQWQPRFPSGGPERRSGADFDGAETMAVQGGLSKPAFAGGELARAGGAPASRLPHRVDPPFTRRLTPVAMTKIPTSASK